jgi:hypothetical protein
MPYVLRPPAALLLCLIFIGFTRPAAAQSTPAAVEGMLEASGAPLADGTVTFHGTALSYTVRTDTHGRFILRVEPGLYRVELTGDQLQGAVWPEIRLQPGQRVRLRANLTRIGSGVVAELTELPVAPLVVDSTTSFDLSEPWLARLPLDRRDPLGSTADLFPGIAGRSALGSGAETATVRRVDGIDLSDPLDGRQATSYQSTTGDQFVVRAAGTPASEGGVAGAIVEVVSRSGGKQLSGLFDARVTAEGLRGDNLSEELLARNPLLADTDVRLSDTDVSAWIGGPLAEGRAFFTASMGYARERDDPTGPRSTRETSIPRALGRLGFTRGETDTLTAAVLFEDRSTSGVADAAIARVVTDEVADRLDARTIAARVVWQRRLSRSLLRASYSLVDGSREVGPDSETPGRVDEASGAYTGSLGERRLADRQRHVVDLLFATPVQAAGAHHIEMGVGLDSSHIHETTRFIDDRLFLDFGGRPNVEIDWAGSDRTGRSRRVSAYVQDGWAIGSRLTVNAGVRLDQLRGATPDLGTVYQATSVQPRAGATIALDADGRTVARVHYGQYAEPLWFTHYDRATPGVAPLISYLVQPNGVRREIERVTTPVYAVDDELRHPHVDETTFGLTHRLTSRLRVGATGVLRDLRDVVDAVFPDARWISVVRPGLAGSTVTVYRWANRIASEGHAVIGNVDGVGYLSSTGASIGAASATRRYRGLLVDARYDHARDRFAVWGAYAFGRNEGTVDDTLASSISRSWRFASPSAALVNVDGRSTNTPAQKVTVAGTARVPWVGARVTGIYVGRTGRRYAAVRQFGNETLDFPPSEDGRQVLLEARGSRQLAADHVVDLRAEYGLKLGGRHAFTVYADVMNLLNRATVLDLEAFYPLASAGGSGIVLFEAPTRVRPPRQIYIGARFTF